MPGMPGARQIEDVQAALARPRAEPGEAVVADLRAQAMPPACRAPVSSTLAEGALRNPARSAAVDWRPHRLPLGDAGAEPSLLRGQPLHRRLDQPASAKSLSLHAGPGTVEVIETSRAFRRSGNVAGIDCRRRPVPDGRPPRRSVTSRQTGQRTTTLSPSISQPQHKPQPTRQTARLSVQATKPSPNAEPAVSKSLTRSASARRLSQTNCRRALNRSGPRRVRPFSGLQAALREIGLRRRRHRQ